jgi:hypothetical protein
VRKVENSLKETTIREFDKEGKLIKETIIKEEEPSIPCPVNPLITPIVMPNYPQPMPWITYRSPEVTSESNISKGV